jgi:diketogulonate reductase-like aldo/keto reductase
MIVLTGTTSVQHMREDLAVLDFQLEQTEVAKMEGLRG